MIRVPTPERKNWKSKAVEFGFNFHTLNGEKYWDESAYYSFNLKQIEEIESVTEEINQMCLEAVEKVIVSEELLTKFRIPSYYWNDILESWKTKKPSLYSRIDLVYSGNSPPKFLENNADCPTSLYESSFWQWLWLEDKVDLNHLPKSADQLNSIQEKLVKRLDYISKFYQIDSMHFASCKDTLEDRGTVQYLQDCAVEAGISANFVYIEDIGLSTDHKFTDLDNQHIKSLFKLYPWEFMLNEEFGKYVGSSGTNWLEPLWKSIISNKAILPMLWKMFPQHPNLLPSFFDDELHLASLEKHLVKKPIYSREGANISILKNINGSFEQEILSSDGPYGEEGFVYQAAQILPKFGNNYTLVGSWLVGDQAAGLSIREDISAITQDTSRFLPHVIV